MVERQVGVSTVSASLDLPNAVRVVGSVFNIEKRSDASFGSRLPLSLLGVRPILRLFSWAVAMTEMTLVQHQGNMDWRDDSTGPAYVTTWRRGSPGWMSSC